MTSWQNPYDPYYRPLYTANTWTGATTTSFTTTGTQVQFAQQPSIQYVSQLPQQIDMGPLCLEEESALDWLDRRIDEICELVEV